MGCRLHLENFHLLQLENVGFSLRPKGVGPGYLSLEIPSAFKVWSLSPGKKRNPEGAGQRAKIKTRPERRYLRPSEQHPPEEAPE